MPDIGGMWSAFVNNALVQFSLRFIGLYVLFLYLAMVYWTVRDAQSRTENQITPYLYGLLVVVLNLLGLFLYLIIRLIRPEWNICPYCAKDFDERDWTVHTGGKAVEAKP